MDGFLLLADGMRLDGTLSGNDAPAAGWIVANTAVVGFQDMLTDPSYHNVILALTYPEVGNTGAIQEFLESGGVQPCGAVVRELCENHSHYRAQGGGARRTPPGGAGARSQRSGYPRAGGASEEER